MEAAAPSRARWLLLGLIAASLLLPLLALSSGGNGLAWPDFSDPLLTQLRRRASPRRWAWARRWPPAARPCKRCFAIRWPTPA